MFSKEITLIDTHAHLTFDAFDKDREEVISRAWDSGLVSIIAIGSGSGIDGNEKAIALAEKNPNIFATVGVHPHDASKCEDSWYSKIEKLAKHEKVVAVGEVGLDFHYKLSPVGEQETSFIRFLEIAGRSRLPVIIHSREAQDRTWELLVKHGSPELKVLFHCFSGDVGFAKKVISAGYYISIPGIVTFRNAEVLREVVSAIPLERIVLETDSPYLAPEPNRGKRNEPSFIISVAEKIAEIKGLSVADVARITTLSAKRFFNLPLAETLGKIAYQIRNSLYLNLTNRCTLSCSFCPKRTRANFEVKGHCLKLEHEPSVEDVFQAMGEPEKYDEVVFCGYGEPTMRLEILKVIAKRMKEKGVKKVRLNTDGLANLIYRRNVASELKGLIDEVSVSLNAPDAKTYSKICSSSYGEKAFHGVLEFIKEARRYIPHVVATAVNLPGLDVESIKKLVKDLKVSFRLRDYMNLG